MKKQYVALAFYHLVTVKNPVDEVKKHKQFFKTRDITSRIYISHEGINGQMSGEAGAIEEYKEFLRGDERFAAVAFKEDPVQNNIFPRAAVKVRERLVAFDREVEFTERGEHLAPAKWKEALESEEPKVVIDVRNAYESEIGHFEGALLPPADTFKEFGSYADGLKKKIDPKTKVLMYCTGGIRCEYYSAYMKKIGFERVYQLKGGVINYGHQEGSKHWRGKLFVFDDRLAVPISEEKAHPIANCVHCEEPSDTHYNCANMDCNKLFLSCPSCIAKMKGCCSCVCTKAERVRPFEPEKGNKPFCRKHLIGN